MTHKLDTGQFKFAEKMIILNDRASGLLTRIYNIKKACGDPKSKPAFLSDKLMEPVIKHIAKKFPIVDTRSNSNILSIITSKQDDILKSLILYYSTFADILDFREHVLQLLTSMDAAQCQLDISLSYELTSGYLNLIINYCCLMILMSRVEDKKVVLGLFNAAYELLNNQSDHSFPRLGQLIIDFENPLKKLSEELSPLNRLMLNALKSVAPVYNRRNISAESWRNAQLLSLTANSQQILYAAQTDTIACEYLSIDVMDRWIILIGTICHSTVLSDQTVHDMYVIALQTQLGIRIFRDEVLILHPTLISFFEQYKGLTKRVTEIKETNIVAVQQSAIFHFNRRRFLRSALRELALLLSDEPGLLGPKILYVWMALSFSRDEVLWLLRHLEIWPTTTKKGSSKSQSVEAISDKQLPELLHYMEQLRGLVRKHAGVIQRYYMQYLSAYDAFAINDAFRKLSNVAQEDSDIVNDFIRDISALNAEVTLIGLRLDWCRFQAHVSVGKSSFKLTSEPQFAAAMNTAVFHIRMVDCLDEMLRETSDLSIYCFYLNSLERQYKQALSLPASCRYVLAFAKLCSHFSSAFHEMCPEERRHIIEISSKLTSMILEDTCTTIVDVLSNLCEHELQLAEMLSPGQVAQKIIAQYLKPKDKQNVLLLSNPGDESKRIDRHELTIFDRRQTTLVELCLAISGTKEIIVCDNAFFPREFLFQTLENKFSELFMQAIHESDDAPRRPSILLLIIKCYLAAMQNIDTIVSIDITGLFNSVLLQHGQPIDSKNRETMTSFYTKWYLEYLLRRAATGAMQWSDHLQEMIPGVQVSEQPLTFAPEQYTDPGELQALVQIIGPYGAKHLSERLVWHIASQVQELYRLIMSHKEILIQARSQFDQADKIREIVAHLASESKDMKKSGSVTVADAILQRTAIIGQIFSFRNALLAALKHVLERRIPFVAIAFSNLYNNTSEQIKIEISELGAAMGVNTPVDIALTNAVRTKNQNVPPEELYQLSCLLFVAIAISVPRIADNPYSVYEPSLQTSSSNFHCLPIAVSTLAASLFYLHGKNDTAQRLKEFLALSSSAILRSKLDPERLNYCSVLLDKLVKTSHHLTADVLETCYPYALVRTAFLEFYQLSLK